MPDPDRLVGQLADELKSSGNYYMVLLPQDLLAICGLVQLALRHPNLSDEMGSVGRLFIEKIRDDFKADGRELVAAVIETGFHA